MTKSNMKQAMKSVYQKGLWHILGANMINQIIAFFSNFIVIRVLSKSEFGIYSSAFNIYSFFALASGFGMESAGLQLCSENYLQPERADSYARYSIIFGSGFNIFLGIAICLSAFCFPFPIEGTNSVLALFLALPFLTSLFNFQQMYFRYNLLNAKYSVFSIANTSLILAGSVLGALLFKSQGMILGREFAMLLSVAIGICFLKFPVKRILSAARLKIDEKRDALKIALVSMLNISTGQMLYLLDVFLIGLLLTDEIVVASYKTATIIPNALLFIPSAIAVYIYPYFAQNKNDKIWVKRNFYTVLKYFAPVNAIISLGLVVLAPFIIRLLFGSQYLDGVPVFRLLSVSYFFSATFKKTVGNLLVTQRKLKVNFWVGITESVFNIVSNWILINLLGAIGAAITTLVISIISAMIVTGYFISYLNREIRKSSEVSV